MSCLHTSFEFIISLAKSCIKAQMSSIKYVSLLYYCVLCTLLKLWSLMTPAANARNRSDKTGTYTVEMQFALTSKGLYSNNQGGDERSCMQKITYTFTPIHSF